VTARTHDLAAISALLVVAVAQAPRALNISTVLIAVMANQLGGIAPDIDQPTAPFWRNLPVGGFVGRMIDKMLGGHRFITHSLLGLALFGFGFKLLLELLGPIMPAVDSGVVWWAFMIGMVSHLVLDTFTKEGVPWLLPIPIKIGIPPVKRMRITTGKFAEKLFFVAILIFDVWFCSSHYAELVAVFHHIS
jgi:inner membrane protein